MALVDNNSFQWGIEVGVTLGTIVWALLRKFVTKEIFAALAIWAVSTVANVTGRDIVQEYINHHFHKKEKK